MTEEKKSKGKGCLIVLVAVGIAIVAISLVFMYVINKAKNVVEDFAEGVGVAPEIIEEVKSLNNIYPFMQPENNLITEGQISRFIAIKKEFADKIKSHEAEFKRLDEISKSEEYGLKEVADAFELLSEIRRDFLTSLKRNRMSPDEYIYLTEKVYKTYFAEAFQTNDQKMPKENIELLNKYRAELEELNTLGYEYWGLTLSNVE